MLAGLLALGSCQSAPRQPAPPAPSIDQVAALFARPPTTNSQGRTLLTTLTLTFFPDGSKQDDGRAMFIPWYLGDAAVSAAQAFCDVGVAGLPLSMPLEECVAMVAEALVNRVEAMAAKVLDMASAVPSLEPFKLPAVGLFDTMVRAGP
jgi:hypothetical protein